MDGQSLLAVPQSPMTRSDSGRHARKNQALIFWIVAFATTLLLFFQGWPVADVRTSLVGTSEQTTEPDLSLLNFEILGSTFPLENEEHETALRRFDEALEKATDVPVKPATRERVIWLYSLLDVEQGMDALFPYWLRHYSGLGVQPDRIFVMVHHNAERYPEQDTALQTVVETLKSQGIRHSVWTGMFDSAEHFQRRLELFNDLTDGNMEDWILEANTDEFFTVDKFKIPQFLAGAEKLGATYVLGTLRDRVATDGELIKPASVSENTGSAMVALRPLEEQFPWSCRPVPCWPDDAPTRVVAYKAFLRSDKDSSRIIAASQAKGYFGGRVVNANGVSLDLFGLTPYSRHSQRYVEDWAVSPALLTAEVERYKWHAGSGPRLREVVLPSESRLQLSQCRVLKQLLADLKHVEIGTTSSPRLEIAMLHCVWGAAAVNNQGSTADTQHTRSAALLLTDSPS